MGCGESKFDNVYRDASKQLRDLEIMIEELKKNNSKDTNARIKANTKDLTVTTSFKSLRAISDEHCSNHTTEQHIKLIEMLILKYENGAMKEMNKFDST
jgi:hypothetical protein